MTSQNRRLILVSVVIALAIPPARCAENPNPQENTNSSARETEAAANAKPPVCDFAGLDMKVVSVQTVSEIQSITGNLRTTSDDLKLVVVSLKGNAAAADAETPSLFLQDIQAVYATPKLDKKDWGFSVSPAVGVKMVVLMGGQELWLYTKNTNASAMRTPAKDGALVVAFQLPKYVKYFSVRIPATVKSASGSVIQTIP